MNSRGIDVKYYLIKIYGIVQGVGFRPFVSRLFSTDEYAGSVKNCGSYVEIHLCVRDENGITDIYHLRELAPPRADIVDIDIKEIQEDDYCFLLNDDRTISGEEGKSFFIAESPAEKPVDAPVFIPPDLAVCDDCARELYDKNNRRYLHPFINCTQCGPRLTIIDSLPYDRPRTSMKDFVMCPSCEHEYTDPSDRRYDAQPVCCNDCGPEVYYLEKSDGVFEKVCDNADAITKARQAIIDGKIIAVKGIGGFHLYCNAYDEEAVAGLRRRKGRPAKPFAVMAHNLSAAQAICDIPSQQVTDLLGGPKKPIVLLHKKKSGIPENVAPGNPALGVMLPYAPLVLLIFSYPDGLDDQMPQVLIATSANRSGGVICRSEDDVIQTLSNVCDGILSHNREILTRADDSVVDIYDDEPYMIRRSRGYAPLPVTVSEAVPATQDRDILAFGGELKNTFCIGRGRLMYPSSYIGDLSDLKSDKALEETVERFLRMLDAHPSVIVCDRHPRYRSRALAEKYAQGHSGTRIVEVQHHYAHVLSVMAENRYYDHVIGVAYDGTGYGDDGTIWGGEIFLCDTHDYDRKASITPFTFSGGDIASREGFRVALSMLFDKYDNDGDVCDIIRQISLCDERYVKPLRAMHDMGINSVQSTSCGRLFDAVSAVLGICRSQSFEGEASMGLQFAAERWHGNRSLKLDSSIRSGDRDILPTDALFEKIVEERMNGRSTEELAYFFHEELASMTVSEAVKIRDESGCNVAALSGGCYQNTLLLRLTTDGLEKNGFKVLRAHEIPPNDGGISLGQCLYGMQYNR
ncbi:MAG: carbamoyltransferase HypF [Lachnospiraceae bacterium]|nr:carbamoyltransferase HypF [Lachnospiraceae bacterium]